MDNKTVVALRPAKSPAAAVLLSIFFPFGAGALYCEQKNKALTQFVIFSGLVYAITKGGSGVVFGLALAAFYFYQIFDNAHAARAFNAAAAGQEISAGVIPDIPGTVSSGSVFWGLFLIAIGALLILANFEIVSYRAVFNCWPVAVIIVGLKLVYDSAAKSKKNV
jgi:LiaI-LiaF-like transmembrane region